MPVGKGREWTAYFHAVGGRNNDFPDASTLRYSVALSLSRQSRHALLWVGFLVGRGAGGETSGMCTYLVPGVFRFELPVFSSGRRRFLFQGLFVGLWGRYQQDTKPGETSKQSLLRRSLGVYFQVGILQLFVRLAHSTDSEGSASLKPRSHDPNPASCKP